NFRLGDVGNDEQTGQDFIVRVDRRIAQEFFVNQTEINRGLIGRSIRSVIGNVGARLRIEDVIDPVFREFGVWRTIEYHHAIDPEDGTFFGDGVGEVFTFAFIN